MTKTKFSMVAIVAASFVLSACDSSNIQGVFRNEDGTLSKTTQGAGLGAVAGGLIGRAMSDKDNKAKGTARGAVIGGVIGGLIGNDLQKQEQELRQTLGGTGAGIINQGDRLVVSLPEAITFPVGSSVVKSSLYAPLADIAASMNNYPNTVVQVVGHTDSTGSDSFNQTLSQNRAGAVATILKSNGVASSRVTTVGMSSRSPIASNSTDSGRQANRRVEINIFPTN